jgi:hypothetical protein
MMTLFTCIPVPLPKKYSGKVYIGNIDKEYFTLIEQTDEHTLYSGIVYPRISNAISGLHTLFIARVQRQTNLQALLQHQGGTKHFVLLTKSSPDRVSVQRRETVCQALRCTGQKRKQARVPLQHLPYRNQCCHGTKLVEHPGTRPQSIFHVRYRTIEPQPVVVIAIF